MLIAFTACGTLSILCVDKVLEHKNQKLFVAYHAPIRSTPSLVKFMPFYYTKEEGRPMMVKRKLDIAIDKSLADQEIFKPVYIL